MSCSYPNCTTTMRWSRRKGSGSTVLVVVLLLIAFATDSIVEGFLVTSTTSNSNFPTSKYKLRSLFHNRALAPSPSSSLLSSSRLKATKEDEHLTEEETWSRSGSGDEKSSGRFGVRKRVRAVLEKAKKAIRLTMIATITTNSFRLEVLMETKMSFLHLVMIFQQRMERATKSMEPPPMEQLLQ
jgi:hypothetical protein